MVAATSGSAATRPAALALKSAPADQTTPESAADLLESAVDWLKNMAEETKGGAKKKDEAASKNDSGGKKRSSKDAPVAGASQGQSASKAQAKRLCAHPLLGHQNCTPIIIQTVHDSISDPGFCKLQARCHKARL